MSELLHSRFGLPTKDTLLGLPIGQHITFKAKGDDGKDFFRPYTPTTDDDTPGHVDFVIKVYPEGKMSQHLDKMEVGQTMLFKGPKGRYQYQQGSLDAIGKFKHGCTMLRSNIRCDHTSYSTIIVHMTMHMFAAGMLAGGTGVTPMYQVANAILKNPADKTEITLLFANVSADDILIEEELTNLQALSPQFKVTTVLTIYPPTEQASHVCSSNLGLQSTPVLACCVPANQGTMASSQLLSTCVR